MASMSFDESVQKRAFEFFLERGGVNGNDQEDWFRAENELRPKGKQGKPELRPKASSDRKQKLGFQ